MLPFQSGRLSGLPAGDGDKGALLLTGMCIEMFRCRIVLEFLDEILVFFIIVCGMVIISYKIFCLYGHSWSFGF